MAKPRNELKDLRQFGAFLAGLLLLIGVINFLKGRMTLCPWFFSIGFITIIFVFIAPKKLKPVYAIFTKIAHAIGWVNTRVILALIYFLIITPIAIIRKIMMKDSLNRKIENSEKSYWIKRPAVKADRDRLEKQF
jgi:hypothetical protein